MNFGHTKVQIIRKWDMHVFVFFHVFLKILEDLRYEISHSKFTINIRILNCLGK